MKRVATRVIMVVAAHAMMLHVELHVVVEEIVAITVIMVVMKLHVIIIAIRHVLVGQHSFLVIVDLLLVRPQDFTQNNKNS